jgi:predicted transcriptional regulator
MEAYTHIYNQIVALGESHVYINSYNDDYDNVAAIHYYESNTDTEIAFGKEVVVRHIGLQIYVRDANFELGYARIEAIRALFSAYKYQVITIIQKGDILTLGNDSKNRSEFTINFNLKLIGGNTVT